MQHHIPTPQPKRKRKRAKVIPSSLPPSSPVASSDNIFVLTSPVIERIEDEYDPAIEFDSRNCENTTDALFNFDANLSDPFGFFAVEKKLKAERLGRPKQPPTRARHPLLIRPAQQKISLSVSRSPSPPAQPSSKGIKDGRETRDDDEPPKSSIKGKKAPEPLNPARLAAKLTALLPKKPSRDVNRRTKSRNRPSNETARQTRNRGKKEAMTRQDEINNDEDGVSIMNTRCTLNIR